MLVPDNIVQDLGDHVAVGLDIHVEVGEGRGGVRRVALRGTPEFVQPISSSLGIEANRASGSVARQRELQLVAAGEQVGDRVALGAVSGR